MVLVHDIVPHPKVGVSAHFFTGSLFPRPHFSSFGNAGIGQDGQPVLGVADTARKRTDDNLGLSMWAEPGQCRFTGFVCDKNVDFSVGVCKLIGQKLRSLAEARCVPLMRCDKGAGSKLIKGMGQHIHVDDGIAACRTPEFARCERMVTELRHRLPLFEGGGKVGCGKFVCAAQPLGTGPFLRHKDGKLCRIVEQCAPIPPQKRL
ncbi:hypothetical protein SDC9_92218 [bioreactor metagenome]|uniref:Uncharacterized protein n=1 Tax=bioreactor metagenome TaxID=1076179 RepID=A0A644ZZY0_9ZZZZ